MLHSGNSHEVRTECQASSSTAIQHWVRFDDEIQCTPLSHTQEIPHLMTSAKKRRSIPGYLASLRRSTANFRELFLSGDCVEINWQIWLKRICVGSHDARLFRQTDARKLWRHRPHTTSTQDSIKCLECLKIVDKAAKLCPELRLDSQNDTITAINTLFFHQICLFLSWHDGWDSRIRTRNKN